MTSASAPGLVHGNREDMPYIDHHAVDHGICLCARSQLDPGPCLSFFVPPNKTDSEELCQQLSSLVKLQILWRQALPSPNTELLYGDTYLLRPPQYNSWHIIILSTLLATRYKSWLGKNKPRTHVSVAAYLRCNTNVDSSVLSPFP